jgi:hypothetical protein
MNHFVATAHSATANTTSNNSSSTFDHPHITSTGAVMTIKGRKTTSVSSAATSSAKHTVTASNANGKVTNKRKVNISANGESYTPLVSCIRLFELIDRSISSGAGPGEAAVTV